ncbi:MAG: hypothetical protein AAF989_16600, partial [Planctomycetota bacterium]
MVKKNTSPRGGRLDGVPATMDRPLLRRGLPWCGITLAFLHLTFVCLSVFQPIGLSETLQSLHDLG